MSLEDFLNAPTEVLPPSEGLFNLGRQETAKDVPEVIDDFGRDIRRASKQLLRAH